MHGSAIPFALNFLLNSYFCPWIFHGCSVNHSTTCGSFRACRFATFEIVSCWTLSILHGFSTVATLYHMDMYWSADFVLMSTDFSIVTQPLLVVLGCALNCGFYKPFACNFKRNSYFVDSPRIFHGCSINHSTICGSFTACNAGKLKCRFLVTLHFFGTLTLG